MEITAHFSEILGVHEKIFEVCNVQLLASVHFKIAHFETV